MAKALKIVGTVIVAVALIATGVGAVMGAGAVAGSTAAATAATFATIGTIAGIAGSLLAIVSAIAFKPKMNNQGSQTSFSTNPQSGIPYAIGRTRMSGVRIHADTWESFKINGKHEILGFGVLLSGGGQIDAIEEFKADGEAITFDGTTGNATSGIYPDYMAQKVWLGGAQTSALSIAFGTVGFPSWTAEHKLSGITHAIWALRHDSDGDHYGAGVPEPAWVGRWVRVYDPRLDSTYPGGSGSCRALNESTYVWSRNGALHALTWALGRWQNGKKTFGIGAPIGNIRVADFVEAANVADANMWWCGGVEWSTDSKWDIMKRMLQSSGATPTMTGAMIGCRVYAPRVSVATIGAADIYDSLSFAATKPQRDRFNTIIPRYRSEDHDWEVVSGSPISVSTYVTADGRVRQKEYDLALVQHEVDQVNVDGNRQAGQLAAYELVNSREAGPIQFTTGSQFLGLKDGDCVTINVPDEGFNNVKVMLIDPPKFDPVTGKITFSAETETDSKHAYALGQTTTPPPAFSLTPPDLLPDAPVTGDWALTAEINADGIPTLHLVGGSEINGYWQGIVVQYKKTTDTNWTEYGVYRDATSLTVDITVEGDTTYQMRLAYLGAVGVTSDWLNLTNVTTPTGTIGVKNAVVFLFQRTTTSTAPSVPSTTSTYNFNTADLTGFNNGWSLSLPTTGGDYRWMIKATAIGTLETDTITSAEWSTPAIMSENGTPGLNSASVFLYQRAASTPALPSTTLTYTFATGVLSGTLGSWTQTVPTGSNPLYVTTATAVSTGTTDTIANTEWAAARVMAQDGAAGTNGLNNAQVKLYQRAASTPAAPSGTFTYTFATGVLSGGVPGSWTQAVPAANGNPLYVIIASASANTATDTIAAAEFSGAVIETGVGLNSATTFLYQRAASTPALPSTTLTYTFATGVLSGTLGSWTQTVPTGSNPLYVTTATAVSTGTTDTIANTEWAAARVMAQDGAAGTNGLNNAVVYLYQRAATAPAAPSGTFTYTFATGVLSGGVPGSWTQAVPAADGNSLYVIAATASANTATDTIAAAEFTSPVIMVQNGTPGTNGVSAVSGYITKESHNVFAYANGNVVSYTGASGSFVAFSGVTDISSSFTLTIPAGGNPQGLTYTLVGQTYTIIGGFDAGEDTATLTIRATGSGAYSTVVIDKVFSLGKNKGGYEIVATLPTTDLFQGRTVFLTTDNKLYRYTGSAWTAAVPSSDITGTLSDSQLAAIAAAKVTGQIVGTQITDGAITTAKLSAGSITSNEIAANTITAGNIAALTITGSQIAANTISAGKLLTNTITANEIAAGAITAATVGTNEIIASSANIANGVVSTAKIGDAQITTAKIVDANITTLKIADQAVTIPVSAYTAAATTVTYNTWTTIQQATITSTGAPISVFVNAMLKFLGDHTASFSGDVDFRVLRGATNVFSGTVRGLTILYNSAGPDYNNFPLNDISSAFQDTPGAGSVTYYLQVYYPTFGQFNSNSTVSNRSILLLETKK